MKLKSLFFTLFLLTTLVNNAQTFQDGPSNESDGDFPSKWDLIKGSAQIMTFEGAKVINLSQLAIITPSLQSKSYYLSDNFTLEFDAFFDYGSPGNQNYEIRFWEGDSYGTINSQNVQGSYDPVQVFRHGAWVIGNVNSSALISQVTDKTLETSEPVWRFIRIEYNLGKLKIFIDGIQITNLPQYLFKPEIITIGAVAHEEDIKLTRAIKNIKLTGINTNPINSGNNQTDTVNTNNNTQTENYAYSLPIEDGNSGQILQTNGNGNVNWVDLPSLEIEPHTHENLHTHDTTISENTNTESTTSDITASEPLNACSGLEPIDEGNGIGWRLKGRDPNNYGNIGLNAIDLSLNRNNDNNENNGATGSHAIAVGNNIKANNTGSIAMGLDSKAVGDYCIAMGLSAFANKYSSISIGSASAADGRFSMAIGLNSKALGDNSITMGSNIQATKEKAMAFGFQVKADGIGAIAMGEESSALGDHSIAIGHKVTAERKNSIAIGYGSKAIGQNSISMGEDTESGSYAVALGYKTNASGQGSTALGSQTIASGTLSFASGGFTKATGDYSTAMGRETKSDSQVNTAIGQYNIGGGDPLNWVPIDPLFEVGNGTREKSDNALTILKNGNIGIGTHTPQTKLHIIEGTDASLSTGGYVIIGDKQDENLVFDNNEIMARKNVQPSTLYLQHNGGDVFVGGKVVHSSDERLKQNIENLSYGLNVILQLRPVLYNWKSNPETSQKSIGLIAQEVQPIIKELVTINTNGDNTLGVNYTELIPVLIKALQEQQEIIDDQNTKIGQLNTELKQKNESLNNIDNRVKQIEALLKQDKL